MSVNFTDPSQYIRANDESITGNKIFSIFAWIKPHIVTSFGSVIFVQGYQWGRWLFGLRAVGGAHLFATFDTTGVQAQYASTANVIAMDTWQSVGMSFNGDTIGPPVFYVNGALVGTELVQSPTGTMSTDPQAGFIGNRSDLYSPFNGMIGELAMWRGVLLSAADMANAHNRGVRNVLPSNWEFYLSMSGGSLQDVAGIHTWTGFGVTAGEEVPHKPFTGPSLIMG